ncbi:cytochrome P-450 cyp509A1 [Hesseltinella vesiculosa]|uniref:Cytochrome P-450 cyp509A1 n=1 Tax=Hesseltinella vesiculosa TaxID=101127 RepID=A0A1X2GK92_9FUNG|nr:cytochrome P-450 cyp509A1 [Hesseltinella vesiculosa]
MSQIIEHVNRLKTQLPLDSLINFYETYLAKHDSKGKRITLGVAISLAVVGRFIYNLGLPPKHLRRYPYATKWAVLKRSIIDKEPISVTYETLYQPLLKKGNGICVLPLEAGDWAIDVINPQAVKQILMKNDLFPKTKSTFDHGTLTHHIMGNSNIVFAVGDDWKRHRKVVNPAFKKQLPAQLFGNMTLKWFNVLDRDNSGDEFVVDFHDSMERLTLDIIGKSAFDFEFKSVEEKNSYWKEVYDHVMNAHKQPLYALFNILDKKFSSLIPSRKASFDLADEFLGMLKGVIEKKRASLKVNQNQGIDEKERDLLSLMIESEMRGDGQLSDEEILNDLVVFFIAGHDTTASSLCSVIYWLARYPEIQEKVRREVNGVMFPNGEPKEDVLPTLENTKQFVYINQVIKEALRLGGPAAKLGSGREAQQDVQLAGIDLFIPKGTLVNVNVYGMHHSEQVWEDPEAFNPDRFGEGGESEQHSGLAWVPFSNGQRQCIGMNFSIAEQRVIIAMILRRYELALPADSIHHERYVIGSSSTLAPVDLQIQFKKRY